MINGQLNMNMLEVVTLPVSSGPPVSITATTDSALQIGSDFAELLNGIQLQAEEKTLLGSEQNKQQLAGIISKQLVPLESSAESPASDLLVQLQAVPLLIQASETASPKQKSNDDIYAETQPLGTTPSDVTSQFVLAAYSQPGRMPEFSIQTPPTVDMLQNVATNEQPAAITASAGKAPSEQAAAVPILATALKAAAAMSNEPIALITGSEKSRQQLEQFRTTVVNKQPATTVPAEPNATNTKTADANPVPSDRISEINKPSALPVDRQQNVATATEQPDVITAPAIRLHPEQTTSAPTLAAAHKPAEALTKEPVATAVYKQPVMTVTAEPTAVQPVPADRISQVNKPSALPVDRLQNVVTTIEQPAVRTTPDVGIHTEQTVALPTQDATYKTAVALAKEPVAPTGAEQDPHQNTETIRTTAVDRQPATTVTTVIQPAESNRTLEAIKQSVNSIDRLQKVAPAIEPLAVSDTVTFVEKAGPTFDKTVQMIAPVQKTVFEKQVSTLDTNQRQQTEPVRISDIEKQPTANMATSATATSMPDESIVTQGLKAAIVPAIPAEKQVAVTVPPQTERSLIQNSASNSPVLSLESELDIQMSQARPITAIVTTAPVLAETRSAVLGRQQMPSELQIEKTRTGNEKNFVKETTSSLQITASTNEAMGSYDSSGDGEMNQGQSDSASDNLMLAQNMRGQLSAEIQKVTVTNTKPVFSEPVRQEIPEQVMQQVKERLAQHDVKPGNQQISLTLSPENLGELKMNLNLQGQKLSVEIVTENRAVRDAIILHTDALKESLARQNITMESFDVTTGGKGSGGQGQNHNAWRELAKQQQQQQLWTSPRGYNTAQADLPSSQAFHRQQGQSMLDIHY